MYPGNKHLRRFEYMTNQRAIKGMRRTAIALLTLALAAGGVSLLRAEKCEKAAKAEKTEQACPRGGYLGVAIAMILGESANDKDGTAGARVEEVVKGKPAEAAGIKVGDVLVSIDGREIHRPGELIEAIARKAPGSKIKVGLKRDQQTLSVVVTLGEAPAREIHRIVERRLRGPDVFLSSDEEAGYLGVQTIALTRDLAEYFGVPEATGVLVTEIVKDSPAAQAGLKGGDVILTIDGRKVTGVDRLLRLVRRCDAGEGVELGLRRHDQNLTVKVKLGKAPEGEVDGGFHWFIRPPRRAEGPETPQTPRMKHFEFTIPDLERWSEDFRAELEPLREMAEQFRVEGPRPGKHMLIKIRI